MLCVLRIAIYTWDPSFLEETDGVGGNPIPVYDFLDLGCLQEYTYILGGEDHVDYNFDQDYTRGGRIYDAGNECVIAYTSPSAEPSMNGQGQGFSVIPMNEIYE